MKILKWTYEKVVNTDLILVKHQQMIFIYPKKKKKKKDVFIISNSPLIAFII